MKTFRSRTRPGKDYFGGPIKIAGEAYSTGNARRAGRNEKQPGVVRVDLSWRERGALQGNARQRLSARAEAQRRKVYAVRARRKCSAFSHGHRAFTETSGRQIGRRDRPGFAARRTGRRPECRKSSSKNFEGDGRNIICAVDRKQRRQNPTPGIHGGW